MSGVERPQEQQLVCLKLLLGAAGTKVWGKMLVLQP